MSARSDTARKLSDPKLQIPADVLEDLDQELDQEADAWLQAVSGAGLMTFEDMLDVLDQQLDQESDAWLASMAEQPRQPAGSSKGGEFAPKGGFASVDSALGKDGMPKPKDVASFAKESAALRSERYPEGYPERQVAEAKDYLNQPRHPAGSKEGGRFAPKGGGGGGGFSPDPKDETKGSPIARKWADMGREYVSVQPGTRKPVEDMTDDEFRDLPVVYHGLKPGFAAEGFLFVTRDKSGAEFHGDVTAYRILPEAKIYPDIEGGLGPTGKGTLFDVPASSSSAIIHANDLVVDREIKKASEIRTHQGLQRQTNVYEKRVVPQSSSFAELARAGGDHGAGTLEGDPERQGAEAEDYLEQPRHLFDPTQQRAPKGSRSGGRWVGKGSVAAASLTKSSLAWHDKLSDGEIEAVARYTGVGHQEMNRLARSGKSNSRTKALDKALSKSTVSENVIAYRGFANKFTDRLLAIGQEDVELNKLVGKVFSDKGFVSTTLSRSLADSFGSAGLTAVIKIPKGSKGAFLNTRLSKSNAERVGRDKLALLNEKEILLPRNSKFVLRGVTNGRLELDYVGQ